MSAATNPWVSAGLMVWLSASLWWLWQAAQGLKRDLVRRTYRQAPDFTLGVVIPLMSLRDSDELSRLLQALSRQDYPMASVQVHVVSALAQVPLSLPDELPLSWWQPPEPEACLLTTPASLQVWATQRLLASQAPDLLVFLQPSDLVRQDFLLQIANRAYEESVLQCYQAIRPSSDAEGWQHWQQTHARQNSRLSLAASFHAGLGLKLQSTGVVIKPSLLEKIPPASGVHADWSSYTLRLLARGVSPGWAPHAVVFKTPQTSWWRGVHQRLQAQLDSLSLARQSGAFVLKTAMSGQNLPLVSVLLGLLWQGLGSLRALVLLVLALNDLPLASVIVALLGATRLLALLIARIPAPEAIPYLAGLALIELATLPLWPLALYDRWHTRQLRQQQRTQQRQPSTRLNEALAPADNLLQEDGANYHGILDEMVSRHEQMTPATATTRESPATDVEADCEALQMPDTMQLRASWEDDDGEPVEMTAHQVHTINLSYGQRLVPCELHIHCEWDDPAAGGRSASVHYRLKLVYKTHRFTTGAHVHLLTAYDELADKLSRRGFALQSCGACAYFYQADEQLPLAVCAFGQPAADEPPTTADADGHITVATPSCPHFDNRFADSADASPAPLALDPAESETTLETA